MKRRNFTKTTHTKEYERKRFKNPFFESREDKEKRSFKALLIIFIILVITVPSVLVFGPFFELENASVSGLTTIPESEVESRINAHLSSKFINIIPRTHKWFIGIEELHQNLQNEYNFERLSIELVGDELVIDIEEKISSLAWKSAGNVYFIDLEGKIFRELLPEEKNEINERLGGPLITISAEELQNAPPLQPTLPIIQDLSEQEVKIGDEVISPVASDALIQFDKNLRASFIDPVVYQVDEQHKSWLRVKTHQGYDILFDGLGDMDEQVGYLNSVLADYKDRIAEISYIDIRFGNHVFVK